MRRHSNFSANGVTYEDITETEKRYIERLWIARFKRAIRDMPSTLELVAYDGSVAICEKGALRAFLDAGSNFGTAEQADKVNHSRIHTHSESL